MSKNQKMTNGWNNKIIDILVETVRRSVFAMEEFGLAMVGLGEDMRRCIKVEEAKRLHRQGHAIRQKIINSK